MTKEKFKKSLILKMVVTLFIVATFAIMATGCGGGDGQDENHLRIAFQPHPHGLPNFIAIEENRFADAGLTVEYLMFVAGPAMTEALGADEWDVGVMGSPPAINAALAFGARVVAFGEPDAGVDFFVRPDSEIAGVTGQIPGAPNIRGTPDMWRGSTIFSPVGTGAHFLLLGVLDRMGLTSDDVNIIPMDVAQAYVAFQAGEGDIITLWDPMRIDAEAEGFVTAATGRCIEQQINLVLVASERALAERYDAVMEWVRIYFEVTEDYKDDLDALTAYLLELQLENGLNVTEDMVREVLRRRPLPTLADQAELWAGAVGSRRVDIIMNEVMDYFISQGMHEEASRARLFEEGFLYGGIINSILGR